MRRMEVKLVGKGEKCDVENELCGGELTLRKRSDGSTAVLCENHAFQLHDSKTRVLAKGEHCKMETPKGKKCIGPLIEKKFFDGSTALYCKFHLENL